MDGKNNNIPAPERGARRRKLAGYLRSANELRQSYQQAYGLGGQKDGFADDDGSNVPGAFPDGTVVRNGGEEMLLFPSYASRLRPKKAHRREEPGASQDIRSEKGSGNAEYWKKEWEKYEKDNSVVQVDIRGWIYAPQRGPMTRKQGVFVAIARRLVGIPASTSSRTSSPQPLSQGRNEARISQREEEMVEKEAESIARRGQGEAEIAWQGQYSEAPGHDNSDSDLYDSPVQSRSSSPDHKSIVPSPRSATNSSLQGESDMEPKSLTNRPSWRQPSEMTSSELSAANAHLMVRLKHFMTTPLDNMPLTIFFYNDQASMSRSIVTDDSGHFSLRAGLNFEPTHVRVLASDKLSATEEVKIIDPSGISVISDIDDTIKHSGISSGAKEIFRNVFIRDLDDLTIDGVKEWYSTMAGLDVQFHYVSNSPWQIYPVLMNYFAGAGLPKGSFHLKQYTGALYHIFEPVAERKKPTLDKIMADFPERRFILIGDSGEADLELYTDIMLVNPDRIIGVFIRDVTTTKLPRFFDSADGSRRSALSFRGRRPNNETIAPLTPINKPEEKPPALPPRQSSIISSNTKGPTMGTLLDLSDDSAQSTHPSATDSETREAERKFSSTSMKSVPPNRPSKPQSLRSTVSVEARTDQLSDQGSVKRKAAPPLPPKPRQSLNSQDNINLQLEPSARPRTENTSAPGSRATSLERQSYRETVRNRVTSASNALSSLYYGTASPSQGQSGTPNSSTLSPRQPPPVPPRRSPASYSATGTQYASDRISNSWSGYNNDRSGNIEDGNPSDPMLSKKEEMWVKRWARAQEIFEDKGVVLKRWRTGQDVADVAIRLIERANRHMSK